MNKTIYFCPQGLSITNRFFQLPGRFPKMRGETKIAGKLDD